MSDQFWLGSELSANVVVEAQQKVEAALASGTIKMADSALIDKYAPPLAEKRGATGIVHITGSLVKGTAGWGRLYGVTGYDDIASAMVSLVMDPDVEKLLFHVDSGGGHVAGLDDFAQLVTKVSSMKPSVVYADNLMASAAYWAGASVQGPIYAGPSAEVGSLGVLQIHRELTKAFEAMGITYTVLRAGEHKARMNPFEELTPEAKAHAEAQLADLHTLFKKHVRKSRPNMTAEQLADATDGRTHLGQRAVSIGLVDRITSFEQALKLLDTNSPKKHTSANSRGATMPYALTEAQIAQIAAGKSLEDIGAKTVAQIEEEQAAAAAASAAAAAAASKTVSADTLAHVQAQLDAKTVSEAKATAELATLKADQATMQTTLDGLTDVARKATGAMLVALGGSADALAADDGATLVKKYAETRTTFEAKFPVGGKASATKVEDADKKPDAITNPGLAMLANRNAK